MNFTHLVERFVQTPFRGETKLSPRITQLERGENYWGPGLFWYFGHTCRKPHSVVYMNAHFDGHLSENSNCEKM